MMSPSDQARNAPPLAPHLTFDSQEEVERAIASLAARRDSLKRLNNEKRLHVQRRQKQQKFLKNEHDHAKARLIVAQEHHETMNLRFVEKTIQLFSE